MPPKGDNAEAGGFLPRSADAFVRKNTRTAPRRVLTGLGFPLPCRTRTSALRAFTQIELLVVLAVLGVLVLLLLPALARAKSKAQRISCVSHLKNIGLAYRIFATDCGGFYPFQISTNGTAATNRPPVSDWGTREFAQDPASAWRHFAALSNELSLPRIVQCPADKQRVATRNWAEFTNNRFLSYTVGLSASEDRPQTILAGDRNLIINGASVTNSLVSFRTNANVVWDQGIHVNAGNLLLGDGSVQQVSSGRLHEQIDDAVIATREPHKLVIP
jgi:prepilin-type N-terminal cleavage/methylation domain-containing protein